MCFSLRAPRSVFGLGGSHNRRVFAVQPSLASPTVKLIDNPREMHNRWNSHNATRLRMEWAPQNLTSDFNAKIHMHLVGYWEDTDDHRWETVGTIA